MLFVQKRKSESDRKIIFNQYYCIMLIIHHYYYYHNSFMQVVYTFFVSDSVYEMNLGMCRVWHRSKDEANHGKCSFHGRQTKISWLRVRMSEMNVWELWWIKKKMDIHMTYCISITTYIVWRFIVSMRHKELFAIIIHLGLNNYLVLEYWCLTFDTNILLFIIIIMIMIVVNVKMVLFSFILHSFDIPKT